MRVLIVGAGRMGLTAAIELARLGVLADVVARRLEPSTFSRAVGILPSSLRLLQPSGATDRIRDDGVALRRAFMFSDRRELLDLLLVGETASVEFSDGRIAKYDHVIGADGVGRAVRTAVGIAYEGFDLPGDWSIADFDTNGWPYPDALTACLRAKVGVILVVPLQADRFLVVSNTPDALGALPLPMDIRSIRRIGTFRISIRHAVQYATHPFYLAGDAAHCHLPAGGRGMNLGLSDAAELAAWLVRGDFGGYRTAPHAAGKKVIAKSEGTRKIMTATSPAYRLAIRSTPTIASFVPFMQRMLFKSFVDG